MTLKAKSTFFTIHNSLLLSVITRLNSSQKCKGNSNSDCFSTLLFSVLKTNKIKNTWQKHIRMSYNCVDAEFASFCFIVIRFRKKSLNSEYKNTI